MKSSIKALNIMYINQILLLIILVATSSFTNNALSQNTDTSMMNIVVKDGDSLSKLATTYGITVSELMDLNSLTSTAINTGLNLVVPSTSATSAGSSSAFNNTAMDNQVSSVENSAGEVIAQEDLAFETITVTQGDTLSSLAITYGSSIEAIQTQNQLSDVTIFSGQLLDIPLGLTTSSSDRLPDALGYITVMPNDTISALAQTYCSSPELLMGQNNLLEPDIFIGQRLFVGQLDTIRAMSTIESNSTITQQQ